MPHLTPTQKRILQLLPATPGEIAQVLYGRATASERNLVYVHVTLLRRRLNGTARITSRPWPPPDEGSIAGWPNPDGYSSRIIYELDREPNISEGIH
jgi:hypothetical protein